MRYVGDGFTAKEGKTVDEKSGAANAVGVEITVDSDALTTQQGTVNPGYRLFHIRKEKGITLKVFLDSKEGFSLGSIRNTTVIQKLIYQRRKPHFCQISGRGRRENLPATVVQLSILSIFSNDQDRVVSPETKGVG